ncbi:MAG: membrane dipeptidase [bacterium]
MLHYSRRQFLRASLGASAGLVGIGPLLSGLGCTYRSRLPVSRPDRRVLADLHVHAMTNAWNRTTPLAVKYPALVRLVERFANKTGMDWEDCHAAGIDLICVAHFNVFDEWLSMPTDPNPEAPVNTLRMMDQLEEELNGPTRPYARLAVNRSELGELLKIPKSSPEYRIAVIHTLEGGHALGGDIASLEQFARRGVAMICLTHFFNKGIASAANAYPYFPDDNSRRTHQGLSGLGREVVTEMERLGIIVDVTHATATAVEDILKAAKRPLVASHCTAQTLSDHPYSLLDEHIQQIAHDGGVVGVIVDPYLLSNYATVHDSERGGGLRDVVRMVRYIVKLCGNHRQVAIGSDFAGYIVAPSDMDRLSQIDRLSSMLMDEFGSRSVVEDIMANNVIDFIQTNWRAGG